MVTIEKFREGLIWISVNGAYLLGYGVQYSSYGTYQSVNLFFRVGLNSSDLIKVEQSNMSSIGINIHFIKI